MRVLHVFTVPVTRNGITMFALQRLPGLRAAGVEADFASPNTVEAGLLAQIEQAGARVFVVPQKRPSLSYVRALAAIVRREKYDIVHAHGNSSSLFFEMLAASVGGCRARVAHSHNTTCNHLRQDKYLRPLFYRSYTAAAACGRDVRFALCVVFAEFAFGKLVSLPGLGPGNAAFPHTRPLPPFGGDFCTPLQEQLFATPGGLISTSGTIIRTVRKIRPL